MTAPAGAIVVLYVDLVAQVAGGDVIETQTGRRYRVVLVRVQHRGRHAGRQHLRCLVLGDDDEVGAATVHRISWYRRRARGRR